MNLTRGDELLLNALCVRLEERYFFTIMTQLHIIKKKTKKNNKLYIMRLEAHIPCIVIVVNGMVFKAAINSQWVTFHG